MTSRHANSVTAGPADAVGQEQTYVAMLYRLLDQARGRAGQALTQTLGSGGAGGGVPATRSAGRIGRRDDEHEPRLIDWRAPAAHPFYAATPKDPNGLIRRRHIYTRNRAVTAVDDEVFDLDRL